MGSLKEGAGLLDYEIQELLALAGVAQWIEHGPANRKVVGSIPSQGTCLGCGPGPWWGACDRQPYINVFLHLFVPLFPSLKINK